MNDPDDLQALLLARAARYRPALAADDDVSAAADMVVFERCGARYGLPISDLGGIHRAVQLTQLPGLSQAVKGLANVQGRLVAVHDVSALAGEARPLGDEIWLLLGRDAAEGVALLADDVDAVRPVRSDQLRPPPVSLDSVRDCFLGIGEDGVAYLDLPRLLLNDGFFKA